MITGRHQDIFQVVRLLTDTGGDQRVMLLNGIFGSGINEIARYAANYVTNRHYFEDGAFEIDASNKSISQGLFSAISKKIEFMTQDKQDLVESIRNKYMLFIINNISQLVDQDLSQFLETIFQLIDQTENIKIILLTDRKDQILQKNHQLYPLITPLEIPPLKKEFAIQLVKKIFENNDKFKKEYPKLEEEKLFVEFQHTPLQVIQYGVLYQNGQSLEQIYQKQKEEDREQTELQRNKRRENTMFELMYKNMESQHPREIKIVQILSFATFGLTFFDLQRISLIYDQTSREHHEEAHQFGDWQNLLQDSVIVAENSCLASPINGAHSKYTQNSNKTFSEKCQERQVEISIEKQSSTQSQWNFEQIQNSDYKIINNEHLEDINDHRFYLSISFQAFVRQTLCARKQLGRYVIDYLKYMSILSRQLMLGIKHWEYLEFNPYILSTQIDQGIWKEPQTLQYEMIFDSKNENFSKNAFKNQSLNNGYNELKLFQLHEANFMQILDVHYIDEILAKEIKRDDPKIKSYLSEICLNIPSILIMMERRKEALDLIQISIKVCMNFDLEITQAKLHLMQVSVQLELSIYDKDDVAVLLREADNAFDEAQDMEGLAETCFATALVHIKNLERMNRGREANLKTLNSSERNDELMMQRADSWGRDLGLTALTHNPSIGRRDSDLLWRLNSNKSDSEPSSFLQAPQIIVSELESEFDTSNQQQTNHGRKSSLKSRYLGHPSTQITAEYESAIKMLEKSRGDQQTLPIVRAKTWLVQADLMLNKSKNIPEIQDLIHSNEESKNTGSLNTLNEALEIAKETFEGQGLEVLFVRCLLYQAKIEFILERFIDSREKIIVCLNVAKQLQQKKLREESKELFDQLSLKFQIEFNNVFIFAKSFPLSCPQTNLKGLNLAFKAHTAQSRQRMISILQETNKKLFLKFDLLSRKFLLDIKNFGSKVLHIQPHLFTTFDNESKLVIEDDDLGHNELTPKELKAILQPQEGPLNIYLVVIELTNCARFCEVFRELGVPHVIAFKSDLQNDSSKDVHEDQEISDQYRINYVSEFMLEFSEALYPLIVEDHTIWKAITKAEDIANKICRKNLSYNYQMNIGVEHLSNENMKDKLYDNRRIDLRKAIEQGTVCDLSIIRAQTNLNISDFNGPFIIRKKRNFFETIKKIISGGKDINLYGDKGVGKTRLVQEVAMHLRFRLYFSSGIFRIDLSQQSDFEQVNTIINMLKINTSNVNDSGNNIQHLTKERISELKLVSKEWSKSHTEDSVLLVLDNCDSFIQKQSSQIFEMNLGFLKKKIKNLTILLISQEKLDFKLNLDYINLEPFTLKESFAFLMSYNSEKISVINQLRFSKKFEGPRSFIQILVEQASGNAQILFILSMILKYGGNKLLKKVKIQRQNKNNRKKVDVIVDYRRLKFGKTIIDSKFEQLQKMGITHRLRDSAGQNKVSHPIFGSIKRSSSFRAAAGLASLGRKSSGARQMMLGDHSFKLSPGRPQVAKHHRSLQQMPIQSRTTSDPFKNNNKEEEKKRVSNNLDFNQAVQQEEEDLQNNVRDDLGFENIDDQSNRESDVKSSLNPYNDPYNAQFLSTNAFAVNQMTSNFRKEGQLPQIAELESPSIQDEVSQDHNDSGILVDNEQSKITNYGGFLIEAIDQEGSKLKVVLDSNTLSLQVLFPEEKVISSRGIQVSKISQSGIKSSNVSRISDQQEQLNQNILVQDVRSRDQLSASLQVPEEPQDQERLSIPSATSHNLKAMFEDVQSNQRVTTMKEGRKEEIKEIIIFVPHDFEMDAEHQFNVEDDRQDLEDMEQMANNFEFNMMKKHASDHFPESQHQEPSGMMASVKRSKTKQVEFSMAKNSGLSHISQVDLGAIKEAPSSKELNDHDSNSRVSLGIMQRKSDYLLQMEKDLGRESPDPAADLSENDIVDEVDVREGSDFSL